MAVHVKEKCLSHLEAPLITSPMPSALEVLEEACALSGVTPFAICAAADRIRPHAHITPVLTSALTDAWLCGSSSSSAPTQFFFKAECLQKTGSFKFRGATNALSILSSSATRPRAVVAHSSGNHAQALAAAAALFDVHAHVVVPAGASLVKTAAARGYGATIYRCANTMEHRKRMAETVISETGGILLHPFLNADVVAGQGTVGKELLEQVAELDAVVVPIGGGGLISGIAIAVKSARPDVVVIGAEPVGADAAARSLKRGERVAVDDSKTIADGLRASVGELGWGVVSRLVDEVITVSEEEIVQAMRYTMERMKVVIEPSAGVAVAACRTEKLRRRGFKKVGVVLCGGNVDLDSLPWSGRPEREGEMMS